MNKWGVLWPATWGFEVTISCLLMQFHVTVHAFFNRQIDSEQQLLQSGAGRTQHWPDSRMTWYVFISIPRCDPPRPLETPEEATEVIKLAQRHTLRAKNRVGRNEVEEEVRQAVVQKSILHRQRLLLPTGSPVNV